jgi:hypothetical protein
VHWRWMCQSLAGISSPGFQMLIGSGCGWWDGGSACGGTGGCCTSSASSSSLFQPHLLRLPCPPPPFPLCKSLLLLQAQDFLEGQMSTQARLVKELGNNVCEVRSR